MDHHYSRPRPDGRSSPVSGSTRRKLLQLSLWLVGSIATTSVSRAIEAGVDGTTGTRHPVFDDDQRLAVRLLADMIIPPTDTPGAVAAGVPAFMETIVADWYTHAEREFFIRGLRELDAYCQANGGTSFTAATADLRIRALSGQQAIAGDYKPPARIGLAFFIPVDDPLAPFFHRIRELVVLGYYTSELGATRELIYEPMVHEFDGACDFSKVGRQYSL